MYKVLFVCLGNICRSPLAEGIFNKLIVENGLQQKIQCDSAGTSNYHIGDLPDSRTIKVATKNGMKLTHRGRQFTAADFSKFDLIVPMDSDNKDNILELATTEADRQKTILMRSYDSSKSKGNVPDPWFGEMTDFEFCHRLLRECCSNLLQDIKERIEQEQPL